MSRASTERNAAVETMTRGVVLNAFTKHELSEMLMDAFKGMTVHEMESLLKKNTRFEDFADLEMEVDQ